MSPRQPCASVSSLVDTPPKNLEVRQQADLHRTGSDSCSSDSSILLEALEKHKAEQKESFLALKNGFESRMDSLEDRVNNLDAQCSRQSLVNIVDGMRSSLDEAYLMMQESFHKAQTDLVQTGMDLAAQLERYSGNDNTTIAVCEALTNSIMHSLDVSEESASQKPRTKSQHGQATRRRKLRQHHSCPPIMEENEDTEMQHDHIDCVERGNAYPEPQSDPLSWRTDGSFDPGACLSSEEKRFSERIGDRTTHIKESSDCMRKAARREDPHICESLCQQQGSTKQGHIDAEVATCSQTNAISAAAKVTSSGPE